MTGQMRTSVDIDAGPELVWEVVTDVAAYPEWTPILAGAKGTFGGEDPMVITFPPLTPLLRTRVPVRVLEVTPGRRLRFRLRWARLGIPGLLDTEHTITLTDHDGGVRLWLEMRLQGLLLPLLMRRLNRDRATAFGPMSAALKERIEGMRAMRAE
jgi:hypothetical protein